MWLTEMAEVYTHCSCLAESLWSVLAQGRTQKNEFQACSGCCLFGSFWLIFLSFSMWTTQKMPFPACAACLSNRDMCKASITDHWPWVIKWQLHTQHNPLPHASSTPPRTAPILLSSGCLKWGSWPAASSSMKRVDFCKHGGCRHKDIYSVRRAFHTQTISVTVQSPSEFLSGFPLLIQSIYTMVLRFALMRDHLYWLPPKPCQLLTEPKYKKWPT